MLKYGYHFQSTHKQTMRRLRFQTIAAVVALAAVPLYSVAQEKTAPTPPGLQRIDEGEQPAVTIRQPQSEKEITEKRDHGQVTEIKVKSGKSTYYLRPNNQIIGGTASGSASNSVVPPEWVVHEFDLGVPKKDNKEESAEPAPVPAPSK